MTTITQSQLETLKNDLERIASETITIEVIHDVIYVYCSEIASLRLLKAYRKAKNADAGFSENLNTFFFNIDLGIDPA
jgi:hypothetical protein